MSGDGDENRSSENLAEIVMQGVPEGAAISAMREDVLPARKWVDIGYDGIQIYLRTDEDVRYLVRTVRQAAPGGEAAELGDG